ncbi:MAG: glycoside hydrolase family 5 protein [Kiritimatiellae bacterium]|nr:glycoside hydrolase family 5 protein [Kiritimatiellia bacterium]
MPTPIRHVLAVVSALAALSACADVQLPSLSWTPSNNKASISGNIATIALPGTTKQSGYVKTPFDMSAFVGKAFELTVNASLEGVGGLTYGWEGLKFQFSFHDDLRGEDNHIDGDIPQKEGTTSGWEQLRVRFDPSKYSTTSGTLTLGIQSAYGTARLDLSSLAIRETQAICEATNQNLVVSYPARIRDLPQRKGAMSPTDDMNEGDFRTLGSWGANLLRFEMANCPSASITNVPAYLEWVRGRLDHLENVILPLAEKYGMLVVVDLHNTLGGRIGGYSDFAIMDDDALFSTWIDLWREIAARFRGDRRIYGYDLCNEPRQGNARKRSYWQIQQSAAEAIREIDPDATIVMEADDMDAPDAFVYLSPLSLDNVVYQVHMYEPGSFTHQGLDSNPYGATYPGTLPNGETFNKAWLREKLAPVRAFQQKHHVRILVGEFSAICWAPGADAYLRDLTDIFAEYGWDWCYMAFRAWGGWSLEHRERNAGEPTRWDFVASPDNSRKSAIISALAAEPAVPDFAETRRRVEVTSLSASSATLSFGAADGKAYELAVGWGDEDCGAETNSWANFAVLGSVGAAETTRTVALPQGWGDAGATRLRFFLLGDEQAPVDRLEYVESDGSQWIDTMARGASGVIATADVACLAAANATLLGSRVSSDSSTRFFPLRWTSGGKWSYGYGAAKTLSAAAVGTGVRHKVRAALLAGEQSVVVDGAPAGNAGTDATERDTELPMFLFAANVGGEPAEGASARLYGARIEANGRVVRDFAPCRDLNGVVCLYDRVSSEYFRPEGGALVAGPSAAPDIAVRAVGPLVKASGSGDLVVQRGSPVTLSESAAYGAVRLHDALTLTGGTLTAGTIEVLPPAGGVLVANGGAPASSARISLAADATSTTGVADVLRLERGATTLQCATNYSRDVVARIVFAGGSMRVSSWDGTPLCTTGGSRWVLEGEGGHAIHIGELGQQRFHWHTGDGFIETRGDCEVVISDTQSSSSNRGFVWFDDARTAWNHTGSFVLSNGVHAICRADDCLPHGNDTGGVRLKWINRALPSPILDLNGHRITVNEINAGGGVVTNSAATRATLRLGENDMGGMIAFYQSLDCGNIDIEKTGSGQNGLDVGTTKFGDVRLLDGSFLVRGAESDVVTLGAVSVASNATLIVTNTTVHAASYSSVGELRLLGAGQFLYDAFVVEKGMPATLDTTVDCPHALLRDKLTIASGGSLASPLIEVDGLDGGIVADGGTVPSSSRLRLADGLEATASKAVSTVLTLRSGTTTLQCATNANPDVAARILFKGGSLRGSSFSGTPLCAANGAKWMLEGDASSDIVVGELGLQRISWLTGDGVVETRGDCDVVLFDGQYNAANDWRGTVYLNAANTIWNHTGDLVLSNTVLAVCRADDCLPSGPQTGVVRLKWVNRSLPQPVLDLNGHSVSVNGIDTSLGGVVTNSSRVAAAICVGEDGVSGQVAIPALAGGGVSLVKRGAVTNTVALGSSGFTDIRVEEGALVVAGASPDTVVELSSVTVTEGATLVLDGVTLAASSLNAPGRIERIGGGDIEIVRIGVPWFSAHAADGSVAGGAWTALPPLLNGAYSVQSIDAAIFEARERRRDCPRVEVSISQDGAVPADLLDELLAEAVERGARARFLAVKEADGETLSWRGLVVENGAAAWRQLVGAPVATGALCRVAAEFDFSGATPLMSYLIAVSGETRLRRLRDALGETWFPANGATPSLAGRVEVMGRGDLFAIYGTAASDARPTPADRRTVIILR